MRKKKTVARSVRAFFGKFLKSRNIIVVSEQTVEHFPIGVKLQCTVATLFIGAICWASYSTGSFIAAKNVLREKEERLQQVSLRTQMLGSEMSVLKEDLLGHSGASAVKLSDNAKSILEKYSEQDLMSEAALSALSPSSEDSGLSTNERAMAERVKMLEAHVQELKQSNEQMVEAVRKKTEQKIDLFEDVIAATGMNPDKLAQQVEAKRKSKLASRRKAGGDNESPEDGDADKAGRGGPFVPVGPTSRLGDEKSVMRNVDRMVLLSEVMDALPLGKPVRHAELMSGFGARRDPFTGALANHTGTDLAGPAGSRIRAASAGTVSFAGRKGAYGEAVDIDHDVPGLSTRYGHLSRILVEEGQRVEKGEVIGIQGSTGRSTGAHLHYEVRYNDRPLNPIKFLQAGNNVF